MSIFVTIAATCEEHPKYTGVRRRRPDDCSTCDDVYYLRRIVDGLDCKIEKFEVHS